MTTRALLRQASARSAWVGRLCAAALLAWALAPLGSRAASPAATPSDPSDPTDASSATAGGGPGAVPAIAALEAQPAATALRAFESRLSAGETLSAAEQEVVRAALGHHTDPSVRALAAAVIAWLDPSVAVGPLVKALGDLDARVQVMAAQSLAAFVRRFSDAQRQEVIAGATPLLEGGSDEVACAAATLLAAASPPVAVELLKRRAETEPEMNAGRLACFGRIAGLPVQSITVPDLPRLQPEPGAELPADADAAEQGGNLPPQAERRAPPAPGDGRLLSIAALAAAGLFAGAVLPSVLAPSRDVLLYTSDTTSISHEELSVFAQGGGALVGGALLGGAAYGAAALWHPLTVDGALAVTLGAGSATLLGTSAQLAFHLPEAPGALVAASATTAGALSSLALATAVPLEHNDVVLATALLGFGAVFSGLGTFAAVPVRAQEILGAKRTDFGLGMAGVGAGLFGLTGLAVGAAVDVPANRSLVALTAGLSAAALGTALPFLVVPQDVETRSRLATGAGAGAGLAAAVAAFLLVPDAWLDTVPPMPTAAQLGTARVSLALPLPALAVSPEGTFALQVPLLRGTL